MPTFYSEENRRKHFDAPQFTRMRHRFRGPRESEKVNLEIDQLAYSMHKLYESNEDFRERFIEMAELLLLGGEVAGVDDGNELIEILGLETLAVRAERAIERAKLLRGPVIIDALPDELGLGITEDYFWRVPRTGDSLGISVGTGDTQFVDFVVLENINIGIEDIGNTQVIFDMISTSDSVGVLIDSVSTVDVTYELNAIDEAGVSIDATGSSEIVFEVVSSTDEASVSIDETSNNEVI